MALVGDSLRCPAFIGRQRELLALIEARRSLSKSSGSFALVSGDAGIGKTRLLNEFIDSSRDGRQRHLLITECLHRAGHAFGPVRSAVRQLVAGLDFKALSKPIARALAQVAPQEVPLENAAGGGLEKAELFEALVDFFRLVCSKRAIVWTIEDIHWADESTIEFLAYLAHRLDGMRMLVVATLRSDELDGRRPSHPAIARLQREATLLNVRLQPLSARELHELIHATLGERARLPANVVRDIEERSEGNPLFAEELVKHSVERGPAARQPQLPLSIRAVITQRADGLDADEKRILEYAAVLGQRFDPRLLALVMRKDIAPIVAALRKAFDLNLIVDEDHERLRCRFRHALVWQTVYEGLPGFQTQTLHEEILGVLEGQPDANRRVDELAYHAWRGGDKAKSLRYNEEAGEAAFSVRALPEAIRCFERALESSADPDDRARLYERIASIERLQGRYKQSCEAYESAVQIRLGQNQIDAAAKLATSLVGQLYNMDNQAALPYAERFLATHRASIGKPALDHLLVVCARVACAFYDFAGAERYLRDVSDADSLAPSARLNFLIVQMMRHAYTGNADEWARYAHRVDDLLPHLTPENVVGIENALALTGIYLGANAIVEKALAHADTVEHEWGFRGQRRYYAGVKAAYLYQRGKLADAVPLLEEVADDAAVSTAVRVAAPIAANLAIASGDDSLWERMKGDLLDEARAHLDNPDCLFLLGAYAGLAAHRGDLQRAQDDLRASFGSLSFAAPDAMFVLINAARYLPVEELGRVVELARVAARHAGGASSRANEALVRAIVALRTKKEQESRTLGHDAAAQYASLGWPLLEASALELAGKVAEARAIYERCGAVADAKRLARHAEAGTGNALSGREREIAAMVVAGLKNEEIAKRLTVSTKTVEKHVSSIFRKLHIRSRVQLASVFARDAAGRTKPGSRSPNEAQL